MHSYYSYCSCVCHIRTPSRLRRINPTPVGKVTTLQTTSHFGSNPVFAAGPSTGATAALQEERRLLVEERSRQGSKFGKKHSKNAKLTEIVTSDIPVTKDGISDTETVSSGKERDDIVGEHTQHSNGDSSLSAVTDKIQLDSIAQSYSSLLKGACGLVNVLLYCYYGRNACSQRHFRIVFYTTTVDS